MSRGNEVDGTTGTQVVKYDPKVESAALALLDQMRTALMGASTVQDAKEIHTLAKVAKDRALSITAYNKAAGLIFAAEVAMGQMLLKDRAPAKGGRPAGKKTSVGVTEVSLREILGTRDTETANNMAAAFRKLAQAVTVDQLHSAEDLLTKYNQRLTRKSVVQIVAGTWTPGAKKEPRRQSVRVRSNGELWDRVAAAIDRVADTLEDLRDHGRPVRGARVQEAVTYVQQLAGWLRRAQQARRHALTLSTSETKRTA